MTLKSDKYKLGNLIDNSLKMSERKEDHINICKSHDIESKRDGRITAKLKPCPLPEIDFENIDTKQVFLNEVFSLPLLITGMTGGVKKGEKINNVLGCIASEFNIPMGLGSQKMMILNPEFEHLFDVKKKYPKVFLIGNIGAVSFNYGISPDRLCKVIESFKLNAFAVHLNALQECIQPEGERNFYGLLSKIQEFVKISPVPVIVKEVGSGMTQEACQSLISAGVKVIDVGGKGGTSWSIIEGLRSKASVQRLGALFKNWGFTTLESVLECTKACLLNKDKSIDIIATGGIRSGIDVAKMVASGATMAGVGLPFFRAATSSDSWDLAYDAVLKELLFFKHSLEIAMFCSGALCVKDLPKCVDILEEI